MNSTQREGEPLGRREGSGSALGVVGRALYGFQGFDAAMSLGTPAGGGVPGSAATGLSWLAAFRYDKRPAVTERMVRTLSGTSGYIISISNSGVITAQTANGSATATAPARTLGTSDIGKVHVLCLSHDLAGLTLMVDRAQVGTTTPQVGYSPAALERMNIGSNAGGGSPLTCATLMGWAGRNTPLSLAHFQTICDATRASGFLDLGGISMDHRYVSPQGGATPATISDTIGTSNITFVTGTTASLDVVRVNEAWSW